MTRITITDSVSKSLALIACILLMITNPVRVSASAQGGVTEGYEIPKGIDTSFKAYMDYRMITDTTSPQYILQESAYTDEQGFRRIDDDYIVALGTYYTEQCGDRFIITLEDGNEFTVTVGDIKDNAHTDRNNMYTPCGSGGNIAEFIIDTDAMDDYTLMLGDVSGLGFEGQIKEIKKIIEN